MTAHTTDRWRDLAWQCLAWICAALMVFGPVVPTVAGPYVSSVQHTDQESEESPPVQDDDENSESGGVASAHAERSQRRKRCPLPPVTCNWLAHLPHHHSGQPGYSLPIRTPFERGVNPPLHC